MLNKAKIKLAVRSGMSQGNLKQFNSMLSIQEVEPKWINLGPKKQIRNSPDEVGLPTNVNVSTTENITPKQGYFNIKHI